MHPRTPLVLSAIAFLLALASGAYAWQHHFRTEPVVVAARDLEAGQPLSAEDLTVRLVPSGGRPAGALTSAGEATGMYAAFPLLEGQALTARHLTAAPPPKGMAANLEPGRRVVSVGVLPAHVLGGALSPGDMVDVLVAYQPDEELQPVRVQPLLERVRVVETRNQSGLPTQERSEFGGQGALPHAVLLSVTPDQAQRLIAAAETKGATLYLLLVGGESS